MDQEKSFNLLSSEEERILEMYSRGESYEVIIENLKNEYGYEYSERSLGRKMGLIKTKMKCETQFQMGYLYRSREAYIEKDELLKKHALLIEEAKSSASIKSYEKYINEYSQIGIDKIKLQSMNKGMIIASLFWLAILGVITNIIL